MKKLFLRFWGVIVFTAKRLYAQKGLSLAIALGIITATAITMSIPIYADAAYQKILERDVTNAETVSQGEAPLAPAESFAFMFRYIGSWYGAITWDRLEAVDAFLTNQAKIDLNLPLQQLVRYFKTDNFQLLPVNTDIYNNSEYTPLSWISFGTLSDWVTHIKIVEGASPQDLPVNPDDPVDVWINEDLATELGLQAGETYKIIGTHNEGLYRTEIPVHLAGIWTVDDLKDPYWFYRPAEFRYVFLTTQTAFLEQVLPKIGDEIDLGLWYLVMDNSAVHSRNVPELLNRIALTKRRAEQYLPNTRLDVSPEEKLFKFQKAASSLMVFLYILSIPVLVMIMTFISLVGGMVVSQRQNEIAVLRSRGASIFQVLGFSLLETLLIGGISLAIGAYLATIIAQGFGRVYSFLDFSAPTTLKTTITFQAMQMGLAIVGLTVLTQLIPTFNAARHTIITYKQEQARQMRPPFWQRIYLDFLLFIPAIYGTYLLRQQGGLDIPVVSGMVSSDPFQNPLLVLVPSIGIFAFTLLILRLLPYLMAFFAFILSKFPTTGMLVAARHLARTTGNYHAPLILVVLTLSLSTFTATLAQTLDRHLHDQLYYYVGTDANLMEFGENPNQGGGISLGGSGGNEPVYWVFLPVSEHLKAPGVQAAARVARNPVSIYLSRNPVSGEIIGIDRLDFPQASFWRKDFASGSLGELMNQLALTTDGVLVPRNFLSSNGLKPGDNLEISMYELGGAHDLSLKIVGAFDYFPTWYPDKGPFLVANLDYLFEMVGGEFPYEVWVKTDQGINYDQMIDNLDNLSLRVSYARIAPLLIDDAQKRPERQGLFGLLSVGFTALAVLTVLGFLLYAFFSFRKRFIELGILRAIGLSRWQMMVLLGFELLILLAIGLGTGTALGIWVSDLFIPYLQIGTDQTARIPPFLIQIDWSSVLQIYALFGLLFIAALTILGVLLMRMKIFQAVKLGETM